MNRNSALCESPFEFAHSSRGDGAIIGFKKRRMRNESRDLLKIIGIVGRNSHLSVRDQCPV